jgi:phosphatidylinositol-3,4,5-trisphosphate 3-phosphatase/dual-specificity protein phosphatase PTEN
MLDFCVDLCLYLIKYPHGIAAIHCKAGKGRTGTMSVCYLIFSDLCRDSEEAIIHYAKARTLNEEVALIL